MNNNEYISWEEYFMGIAIYSSFRSKDSSTKVGACIVNNKNHVIALGYNGMPIGCCDNEMPWERDGEFLNTKYPYVCHAELNAVSNATVNVEGARIYVTLFPCNECAKLIIQNGIKEVIYLENKYIDTDGVKASIFMLEKAGIKMRQYNKTNKKIDFSI